MPHFCLQRLDPPGRYPLEPGTTLAGSDPASEVPLGHPAVSRKHAALTISSGKVEIEDLGSKNGTFVNGVRVQKCSLCPGDTLELGPVRLRLETWDEGEIVRTLPPGEKATPALEGAAANSETQTISGTGERQWLGFLSRAVAALLYEGRASRSRILDELLILSGGTEACFFERRETQSPVIEGLRGGTSLTGLLDRAVEEDVAEGRGSAPRSRILAADDRPSTLLLMIGSPPDPISGIAFQGPSPSPDLLNVLRVLLDISRVRPEINAAALIRPPAPPGPLCLPDGFVPGTSALMRSLMAQMTLVLSGEIPALILGETGTGKELIARTLHLSSHTRSRKPFSALNCAAIPQDMLEAELFGIERGAATGVLPREGYFTRADGGVLFLDEIAEMPRDLQAKLLRALQLGEIQPIGARRPIRVDVWILSATNLALDELLKAEKLRRDLYYRLAGWQLEAPALRKRPEDIPGLVEAFSSRFAAAAGKRIRGISTKALSALVCYPWPGNVRELENEIRRAVQLCPEGSAISCEALACARTPNSRLGSTLQDRVDELERKLISEALERTSGNQSRAADFLGLTRNGLRGKMERLGIQVP